MKRAAKNRLGWALLLLLATACRCQDGAGLGFSNDEADAGFIRTARLSHVEGEVLLKRAGDSEWLPAAAGTALATNDKVRTARNSFASIEFEQGGLLRLEPESLVAVTDLSFELSNKARRSVFTLVAGRVEAELDPLERKESEFKIKTQSAEATVLHREVSFQ